MTPATLESGPTQCDWSFQARRETTRCYAAAGSPSHDRIFWQTLLVCLLVSITTASAAADSRQVTFRKAAGQLTVVIEGQDVARYVYVDGTIPRPFFSSVKTLCGRQVTRTHPPVEGTDPTDHATMHPGIWFACGDISGQDFWRNKARIVHERFVQDPQGGTDAGSFAEQKKYLASDGSTVCREEFRCLIRVLDNDWLLLWDSTFDSDREFTFGDQEEMGLGVRVATPISEVQAGRLLDSKGRKTAQKIWSNSASWCDYSGTVDGNVLGVTLFSHPNNFRHSWLHARNYGLMVANPFGRAAMRKGKPSKVIVKPGEKLRLRFGIRIHEDSVPTATVLDTFYRSYLETAGAD